MEASTVSTAFGDVPAYRMDYNIVMQEELVEMTARGHMYLFILNNAMYIANYMTAYPGTECPADLAVNLRTMVNRLTVNGKTTSVKVS